MALPALATATDLATRQKHAPYSGDALAQVEALLLDASAKIRKYTRQQFSRVEDDVYKARVYRAAVTLPQRPADKPSVIKYADSGIVLATAAWWWDGLDTVNFMPPPYVINPPYFPVSRIPQVVEITYSHGTEENPDDVIGIACAMVGRAISLPGVMAGITEGQVDDFRFKLGANVLTGHIALTDDEKADLDVYRNRTGSQKLRA